MAVSLPCFLFIDIRILILWLIRPRPRLYVTVLICLIRCLQCFRIIVRGIRLGHLVVGAFGCGEHRKAQVLVNCDRLMILSAVRKLILALLGNLMTTLAATVVVGTVLCMWFRTFRQCRV